MSSAEPSSSFSYAGVPVVVLGASGFIGTWTVRALHGRGAHVHAVVRPGSAARDKLMASGATTVNEIDLVAPGSGRDVVERLQAATVFNLAGYGVDRAERSAETMRRLNADLLAELCEALAAHPRREWAGQQLVHVGSALEYGPLHHRLTESLEPQPTTDYGKTKLEGTQHVIRFGEAGLRGVVARLFTIYGDGEHDGRLLPALQAAAARGQRLSLTSGLQERDFTYVEDVADGLLRLGLAPLSAGTVVHLATGRLTSVRAFAETAAEILGMPPASLGFGDLPTREEEMFHGEVDVTRLRTILRWTPSTTIADGIRRACERTHVH